MPLPRYHHFELEELTAGVYAAISADAGGLICNAGIVDLGTTTLVFDTGATLPAARELRTAAETLTGRPVTYVVNSHVHPEHVNGNAVYDGATLIASHVTREAVASHGVRWMEQMRRELDGRLEGYPGPADLRVPTVSFGGELTLHGTRHVVRLMACGGAHSECDAVLWLPDSGILFTGDLITDGNLILCYGNPEVWLSVLHRLEALAARVVVPGHGRVAATGDAISRGRAYIRELLDQVAQAREIGKEEDWIAGLPVPEGCGEYWFRANIRFLLDQFSASHSSTSALR